MASVIGEEDDVKPDLNGINFFPSIAWKCVPLVSYVSTRMSFFEI